MKTINLNGSAVAISLGMDRHTRKHLRSAPNRSLSRRIFPFALAFAKCGVCVPVHCVMGAHRRLTIQLIETGEKRPPLDGRIMRA